MRRSKFVSQIRLVQGTRLVALWVRAALHFCVHVVPVQAIPIDVPNSEHWINPSPESTTGAFAG